MEANRYQRSKTDHDDLPVVNGQDEVIGKAPRREVHLKGLLHRSVHIVIMNKKGQVLLQKRSSGKDSFPGYWDVSVGGHVDPGESYAEAARRELKEEMGLEAPLEEIGRHGPAESNGWEFTRLYTCRSEGPFFPDENEIEAIRWVDPSEFQEKAAIDAEDPDWRVTMSGQQAIGMWCEWAEKA